MGRAFLVVVLLCASRAAAAAECGASLDRQLVDRLAGELQQGVLGLAAYAESLPGRPESSGARQLAQELIVLHERIGRAGMLAEIRDAMRHEGEKSFVRFKLSHEASLLKLASSRAHDGVADVLAGRPGIEQGVARLLAALARAESMFAACDSPM